MSEVIHFPPRLRAVPAVDTAYRDSIRAQTACDAASRIESLAYVAHQYAPNAGTAKLAAVIARMARALAAAADTNEPPPSAA